MTTALNAADKNYPKPAPPQNTNQFSDKIQRAMALLGTSTPKKRNTVRILFYGQSITKQDWWLETVADLKKRFPHANIIAENPAIGGFASQKLINTTVRDVRSFYPDLLVFHVFGDHYKYEEIIKTVRELTTADIAMQSDHFHRRSDPKTPDEGWTRTMNHKHLPHIAKKYDCQFLGVRDAWRQYLLDNDYESGELLRDGVHLNEHGCYLMGKLVARELVYRKEFDAALDDPRVKTHEVGKDITFENGKLTLPFEGNRIVAIPATGQEQKQAAIVRIDGKKPSEHPELYTYTRANAGPGVDWPWHVGAPVQISWTKPQVNEDWTITVLKGGQESFTFKVEGSVTGPDGEGSTEEDFASESGRIVIKSEHWWKRTPKDFKSPVKPGYQLKFKTYAMGVDELLIPKVEDDTTEHQIVLASGLPNGTHTLEIDGDAPIRAIRVYCPGK